MLCWVWVSITGVIDFRIPMLLVSPPPGSEGNTTMFFCFFLFFMWKINFFCVSLHDFCVFTIFCFFAGGFSDWEKFTHILTPIFHWYKFFLYDKKYEYDKKFCHVLSLFTFLAKKLHIFRISVFPSTMRTKFRWVMKNSPQRRSCFGVSPAEKSTFGLIKPLNALQCPHPGDKNGSF